MRSFAFVLTMTVFVLVAVIARTSHAQIIVQSNFDVNGESWRAFHTTESCSTLDIALFTSVNTTRLGSGGAPNGYFRTAADTGQVFFRAPDKFLGNKSSAYGGSIWFEQKLTAPDDRLYYASDDVYLIGAGLTLIADTANPSHEAWGRTRVPLLPGYWHLNSCSGPYAIESQIRAALSNITELLIRAQHSNDDETNNLDTVTIDATPVNDACFAQWEEMADSVPTGRHLHAVAVDTDRDVMVLFGGYTGEADTWEFDLASGTWARYQPSISPSARARHAMAYDAERKKIVMTGGEYLKVLDEVWEYDVETHSWSPAAPLPQPRSDHVMVYDTTRHVMVLYGGLLPTSLGALDVLERKSDSPDWITRSSTVTPGAQIQAAMAFDQGRGRAVLIGEGTTSVTVAEWDGTQWELFTENTPATRMSPEATYDPDRGVVVLAGGRGNRSTWEYDGRTRSWKSLANIPEADRVHHALVYDTKNDRVLLAGGIRGNASPEPDVLAYDGNAGTWSVVWSAIEPAPRDQFGMTYDEIGHRTLVLGGRAISRPGLVQQFIGSLYAFDGSTWSPLTTSGTMRTRVLFPMVYVPESRSVLVYGGREGSGNNETSARLWELDLASLAWTDHDNQPAGQRFDHAAAFHRNAEQMVVHGGLDEFGNRLGDTWIYSPSSNAWSQLPPGQPSPGLRNGAAMAYDESRGVSVLFGGLAGTGTGTLDNSTWEWDGDSWANVSPVNGNPPARFRPNLVYDPIRRTVVLLAGLTSLTDSTNELYAAQPYRDAWEWNGTQWQPIVVSSNTKPTALVYGNATYDRTRNRVVYFGGSSFGNETFRNGQTWEFKLPLSQCENPCPADFNTDGFVDDTDFVLFTQQYGVFDCSDPAMPDACSADLNADGFADDTDFVLFTQAYQAFACP